METPRSLWLGDRVEAASQNVVRTEGQGCSKATYNGATGVEFIASRLKAIASRLEVIAIARVEAIATREAMVLLCCGNGALSH